MLILKIWYYLNYKGDFYFCVQQKATPSFERLWTLLDVYGRFWKSYEVLRSLTKFWKSYEVLRSLWTLLEVLRSFAELLQPCVEGSDRIPPVCRYTLAIPGSTYSGKILHKCNESSSTVAHITVSLTPKWEVALRKVLENRREGWTLVSDPLSSGLLKGNIISDLIYFPRSPPYFASL